MWPFRRRKPINKAKQAMERLVAGLIIGGAIGSIVGKKLLDEQEEDGLEDAEETDDDIV